jgi:hypothetical protein
MKDTLQRRRKDHSRIKLTSLKRSLSTKISEEEKNSIDVLRGRENYETFERKNQSFVGIGNAGYETL